MNKAFGGWTLNVWLGVAATLVNDYLFTFVVAPDLAFAPTIAPGTPGGAGIPTIQSSLSSR